MTLFVVIVSQGVAGIVVPDPSTPEQLARRADVENIVSQFLRARFFRKRQHPAKSGGPGFGLALQSQAEGITHSTGASPGLNLIWPHITTLFGLVAVCFGISYIIFMRAEIRA